MINYKYKLFMFAICLLTLTLGGCSGHEVQESDVVEDYLCSDYFHNRAYNDFFMCSSQFLEKDIDSISSPISDLDSAKLHSMRSLLYYELNNFDKAKEECEQCVKYLETVDYSFMGDKYTFDSGWDEVGENLKSNVESGNYQYNQYSDPTSLAITLALDAIIISVGIIGSLFDDNYTYDRSFDDFIDTLGNAGLIYALFDEKSKAEFFATKLQSMCEKKSFKMIIMNTLLMTTIVMMMDLSPRTALAL